MPRVVHFEIHADDPERAAAFYAGLFGWQFTKWGGSTFEYWLIATGPDTSPGINGGMIRRRGDRPIPGQAVNAFVCTVQVDDLDTSLAKSTDLGATLAVPKMPIPGVGWLAYIVDTEGNILGLTQPDPAAV